MRPPGEDLAFEDAISEDWSKDLELVEVPLEQRGGRNVILVIALIACVIFGRLIFLSAVKGGAYRARAEANVNHVDHILAPRGLILDRNGVTLAENRSVFRASLNVREFLKRPEFQEETLQAIRDNFGISREEVQNRIAEESQSESSEPLVLGEDLSQSQVIALKALALPTLTVEDAYRRHYPDPVSFSSLLGYVSLPNAKDLEARPSLSSQDLVGKWGVEAKYDDSLQGTPGAYVKAEDAHGRVLSEEQKSAPKIGAPLKLTIDGDFQKYFAARMQQGLDFLGRTTGAGIAINPQNGEVLALMSFPSYDNEVLSSPGHNDEKRAILNSPLQPLFDRAIGGSYSPGSTIKPLDSVALLKERIIDPNKTIFSPGYLDVKNPYDPANPTRYLDWRFQGNVNLYSAIAQSSDVYYYETVGGYKDVDEGLGITRLKQWWQKFGLGSLTGVDLQGEAKGLLPDPDWKKKHGQGDWRLGDTFNVAIGQGDFQITPIQLANYIASLANGGRLYQPLVNMDNPHPAMIADLTGLAPEIKEVQKGMRLAVTSSMGTAYTLHDLPFPVAAKTGSAQIQNNTKENAFFVGYIPALSKASDGKIVQAGSDSANSGSEIAILILIEHAKEGSLNAVPIAKDIFNWYYDNRLKAK